jgi:hypothetical protein
LRLAVAILVGVELTERQLGRLLPLPKYFLEESLELLAALYGFLAMVHRA